MYYTYIILLNNGQLYAGSTGNLKSRFQDHQKGRVTSTKHKRPLELIFYEGFKAKSDALRREKYFKTSKGKSTLRLMLRDSLK